MKNFGIIISVAILTGFLLMAGSCSTGVCLDETNAYMKASLCLDSTGKVTAPDSLTLYGVGRDTSKIYNAKKAIKQALMPLDASAIKCSFIIRINTVYDTITAWYSTYPHLISEACGYTFYHTIDSLQSTKNIINKITINKNTITTVSEENIRIYYY